MPHGSLPLNQRGRIGGRERPAASGGYTAYRDRPTMIWMADQLARGIFYHARELKDSFTSVFT